MALGGMDERTFAGPTAQFLNPSKCLETCVAVLFPRNAMPANVQGARVPQGADTSSLRAWGDFSEQGLEEGHWTPPTPSTLSDPGAGLHPQSPLVHPRLQRHHWGEPSAWH